MKVKQEESVIYKMRQRLRSLQTNVVLRKDFSDIGAYRLISNGFQQLIAEKKLVRIGFGIYAKAYESEFYNVVLVEGGVDFTLREVLNRLNIRWLPGRAEIEYNQGKSTQVPVRNIVQLKDRCRRRIAYKKSELVFEGKINAR